MPEEHPAAAGVGYLVWSISATDTMSTTSTDELPPAPQRSPLHCYFITSSHVGRIITEETKVKQQNSGKEEKYNSFDTDQYCSAFLCDAGGQKKEKKNKGQL